MSEGPNLCGGSRIVKELRKHRQRLLALREPFEGDSKREEGEGVVGVRESAHRLYTLPSLLEISHIVVRGSLLLRLVIRWTSNSR
jgi:hypothetical protein